MEKATLFWLPTRLTSATPAVVLLLEIEMYCHRLTLKPLEGHSGGDKD